MKLDKQECGQSHIDLFAQLTIQIANRLTPQHHRAVRQFANVGTARGVTELSAESKNGPAGLT